MIILSIGYGRSLFNPQDPERARLLACAKAAGKVHHIVFSRRADGLLRQNEDNALFLYPTHSIGRISMLWDALRIGREILARHPDAIITTQDPLASGVVGLLLARLYRRSIVVQEHGDIFSGNFWRNETLGNRVWYPVARFVIRRADRVRVVSKRVAAHVAQMGVSAKRIRSLAVFSDLQSMRDRAIGEDLRREYKDASVIILSVARFVAQKNLSLLLRAFTQLSSRDPRALLVLVGRGPFEKTLRREAESLGIASSVIIKPWTADVASLMKTSDIYALSSNYEGWARVLPEAMACGLPAVTTDVGCVGEIFKSNRHGLVVSVGDEVGFARALETVALNREMCRSQGARGEEDMRAYGGDITSYARQWAAVYSEINSDA